jgi:hypothetical protein
MTVRRGRDLHRLLVVEAEAYGATVRVERTNGGHLKGIFSIGECEMFIIASFASGCFYRDRNVRTDARRVLRSLTTSL